MLLTYELASNAKGISCDVSKGINVSDCALEQRKIVIEGNNGKEYVIKDNSKGINKNKYNGYDKCEKGYCYITVRLSGEVANICKSGGKVAFDVDMASNPAKRSIRRYEPCDSTKNQSYFVFDIDAKNYKGSEDGLFKTKLICNGCRESVSMRRGSSIPGGKEACEKIANAIYDSERDICYVEDGKECINRTDESGQIVYGELNTHRLSDPSLNCILHMATSAVEQSSKEYYDYSDDFGVNTDVCRVYCSDEVNYYMSNKVELNLR